MLYLLLIICCLIVIPFLAVSGAGGWLPSKGVMWRDGHLVWHSLCQNKPKDVVEQDMVRAAERLLSNPGEIIQVHFVNGNALELARHVRERQNGAVSGKR